MSNVRFSVVLPSYVYNPIRKALAYAAFASLAKTQPPSSRPKLLLLTKPGSNYLYPLAELGGPFEVVRVDEPEGVQGTEQTLAYGTDLVFEDELITHSVWMGDDSLFHPNWLIELEALISRRPEACAWSVYRSAYETVHQTLRLVDDDVLVRSLCGHGLTLSRDEWAAWGINWHHGPEWSNPNGGTTLDLHHVWARPGYRWNTKRSYVDHTGRMGTHCLPEIPEYARDFVLDA